MSADADENSIHAASGEELHEETVDEFKQTLYQMQAARRRIVQALLSSGCADPREIESLRETLRLLKDARTFGDSLRHVTTASQSFSVNLKDEIHGLQKDMVFLDRVCPPASSSSRSIEEILSSANLPEILAPYHPKSEQSFYEEMETTLNFLMRLMEPTSSSAKLALITDWDGTMKNYCSQYATNLQPVYSAVGMAEFARAHTRLAAVLTAGPLRGPGILDLTSLPIDGPIVFSGSWGREWWLAGRRVVYDDGITDDGFVALERLNDEMRDLLHEGEYSQFGLVGSGVQKKVDRLTLGVQTVCSQVQEELSSRYQDAVRERMHRVDPMQQILVFDKSNQLEVEVCVHSSGAVWNKADGVARLLEATGHSLAAGRSLIAGDTASDLPMLEYSMRENPQGTWALFVGSSPALEKRMKEIVGDESRCCYIACPDVFHAALARFLLVSSQVD